MAHSNFHPVLLFLLLAPLVASDFQDLCFKQVQRLAPYDSLLSSRQQFKVEALVGMGVPENPTMLSEDPGKMQELLETLKKVPRANGNESACGPTTSYLAELFLGQKGEALLGFPGTPPAWDLVYGEKLVETFRAGAKKGDHRFYYLATNGAVTQHVLSIEQLPAAGEEEPLRFRVYQSCFDAYTLKAWLEEHPDEESLVRQRQVYGPQNGPDGFFRKKQGQFEGTGVCVMSPEEDWPGTMKQWMTSMMGFGDEDSYRVFEKAQSKYGGGRTLTEEVMFGDDGFVTALARYTQGENDVVHTFPVEVYTQELQEMFEGAFGFPSIDQFVGVPVLTGLDTLRALWNASSVEKAAKSEKAKLSSEVPTGIFVASAAVDESKCEANAETILKSVEGVEPPSDGLAAHLKPETREEVCGKNKKKKKKSSGVAAADGDDDGESETKAEGGDDASDDDDAPAGSVEEKFLSGKRLLAKVGVVGPGTLGGLLALAALLLALAAAVIAGRRMARPRSDQDVELEHLLATEE